MKWTNRHGQSAKLAACACLLIACAPNASSSEDDSTSTDSSTSSSEASASTSEGDGDADADADAESDESGDGDVDTGDGDGDGGDGDADTGDGDGDADTGDGDTGDGDTGDGDTGDGDTGDGDGAPAHCPYLGDPSDDPTPNYAFITSQTITAATLNGLTGADQVCNDAASAAGLPGTYVAWLSDSNTDAIERIGDARGWIRTDGLPFADEITKVSPVAFTSDSGVLHPLNIDENGVWQPQHPAVTASAESGTFVSSASADSCTDFTGGGVGVIAGEPDSIGRAWSLDQPIGCSTQARLYCLGIDYTHTLEATAEVGLRAFVTDALVEDTNVGISGLDALCQSEADTASLGGTFLAAVATANASAFDRFEQETGPWVRLDGMLVRDSSNFSFPDGPIVITPSCERYDFRVNTGASDFYTAGSSATTCGNWSSNSGDTIAGMAGMANAQWFNAIEHSCATASHLYCLEVSSAP